MYKDMMGGKDGVKKLEIIYAQITLWCDEYTSSVCHQFLVLSQRPATVRETNGCVSCSCWTQHPIFYLIYRTGYTDCPCHAASPIYQYHSRNRSYHLPYLTWLDILDWNMCSREGQEQNETAKCMQNSRNVWRAIRPVPVPARDRRDNNALVWK